MPGAPKYYYVNESSYLAEWSRYIDYYLFFYCALGEVRTVDFVISFARQQAKERASALTISRIADRGDKKSDRDDGDGGQSLISSYYRCHDQLSI